MDQVSLYYLTPTGGGFSSSIFTKILDPCISMDARTVGHDEIPVHHGIWVRMVIVMLMTEVSDPICGC